MCLGIYLSHAEGMVVPMVLALADAALLAVALVLAVVVLVPVAAIIGVAAAVSASVGHFRRRRRAFDPR